MKKLKKSDYWETPKYFFNLLDEVFDFTLDACATPKTAKCEKYFTEEDDGLSQSWKEETVFCNPPFSQLKYWSKKCFLESRQKNTTVVMLCPPRTDTKYWHSWIMEASEIWACKGRVNFLMNGKLHKSVREPMCVIIFGEIDWKETVDIGCPVMKTLYHKDCVDDKKVSTDMVF